MNSTLQKFGYPESTIFESEYWAVLIRPKQITLGAMILCTKLNAGSIAEMPEQALVDLKDVISRLESAVQNAFGNEKINYVALMMVDKEFHWHVIPRYSNDKVFNNELFIDSGWPKYPDLKHTNPASIDTMKAILEKLNNE